MPEVIEGSMTTSNSIPTAMHDCTDDIRAEIKSHDAISQFPLSPTLPNLKSNGGGSGGGGDDGKPLSKRGSIRLPVEYSTLPSDGRDLLLRLLEFSPERRIRSIFSLQRIAFFMGFNFDDVRKKKINPLDLMESTEIH